jgi:hypothetical protein
LLGNPVYMEDLMGNSSVNRGFSNKLNHVWLPEGDFCNEIGEYFTMQGI